MFVTKIANELQALSLGTGFIGPFSTSTEYIIGGYYNSGDGGGGIFVWLNDPLPPTLPPADDGGIIIRNANNTTGYFKRIYSGPINVKWFGAKGDGTTNDTTKVQLAITAAGNGTVYFPAGIYFGNFVAEHCNFLGDGFTTVLLAHTNGIPVLKLGYIPTSQMTFAKVSSLVIDGSTISDGIEFNAPTNGQLAGRWDIENVKFMSCLKAVYKPKGNIINAFINCHFSSNEFGFYAEHNASPYMHSGCDRIEGGHMDGCTKAAIFVKSDGQYGQLILDGVVIEGNQGFGIFIKLSGDATMTYNGIELRNVWMELNASYSIVTIDSVNYTPRDMRFEKVRSVSISQMLITDIELIASSVNLYNCRYNIDYIPGDPIEKILVDDKSSVVAYEQRYPDYPGNKIFVNSISYDYSAEADNGRWRPTSVWGPLRVVKSTKLNDIVVSEQFDTFPVAFVPFGGGAIEAWSTVEPMHVLGTGSGKLSLYAGQWVKWYDLHAIIEQSVRPRYCVWSIHTFLESDLPDEKVYGSIISEDPVDQIQLGNLYFKYNQWVCSYGMKLVDTTKHLKVMRLAFRALDYNATFYFTDYQIVMFDDLHSANSFVNSKEFAKRVSQE